MKASDDLIKQYLNHLTHARKLSEHTLRSYRHALSELLTLAAKRELTALGAAEIRSGLKQMHQQGLSARSLAHRLSVWRSFYRWLALQQPLSSNPVAAVRAPKRAKTLPKALSVDDAKTLMEAPHQAKAAPEALRDYAMLELFYSSGLRLSELVGLDVSYIEQTGYRSLGWLDLTQQEVHVTGKGKRQRVVPVGQKAIQALQAWLEVRSQWIKDDPTPLFIAKRGKRMSPAVVYQRVKKLALQAGIPTHVHPHVLRHSFASHILQSSGDLRAVQEMLGHTSLAATQIYTSLDFQHLAQVYDKTHPRAKKS